MLNACRNKSSDSYNMWNASYNKRKDNHNIIIDANNKWNA
jgi:hypothetical protein